ncbi:MAG: hypothetical protein BM485_10575 [Desulfobulbaceae bacterium DB1]|nr:MAG: hypothetical protein BM485_10575 [Desulfobulbaceae bacterium DB1]
MEHRVRVENSTYRVEYEKGSGKMSISVDGRLYLVDFAAVSGGFYSVFVNDQAHDLFVCRQDDRYEVIVHGRPYPVDFFDPRSRRVEDATQGSTAGTRQIIRAPMAGRIVRIQMAVGDMVRDGEGLIVLEAMKMENELKSQAIGRVKEISVKENDVVAPGRQLMIIE